MRHSPFIVGLGGTMRDGSQSELALRACLFAAEALGARTLAICGSGLDLPIYGSRGPRTPAASALLAALRGCDGLVVASPSYHGSISGALKNVLDYAEDLRTEPAPYLENRAVGCIVCAQGWQAVGTTLTALRSVVHALRAWPTPMGAGLNSAAPLFGPDGACIDASARAQLELVASQVVQFSTWRHLASEPGGLPARPHAA